MLEVESITFACEEPDELAAFWEAALDGERRDLPPSVDDTAIVDPTGDAPDLLFREAPKGTERDLPIHLDLSADDREGAVDRLVDLGASVRETKTEAHETFTATWAVLEDPEGNGFCVSEYS
ncbi:VOC family protein [Halosimplex pelagicum]|uniref:VOC family protein n=1 Tax=Halosimplex pelagicum TaxID=869886 RepID=A0A7D5P545_9EURY|nr:VOC family protein [Halosimplex pelagicum]QLH81097.1 VOC family protein [Halosimplex pelagicum]